MERDDTTLQRHGSMRGSATLNDSTSEASMATSRPDPRALSPWQLVPQQQQAEPHALQQRMLDRSANAACVAQHGQQQQACTRAGSQLPARPAAPEPATPPSASPDPTYATPAPRSLPQQAAHESSPGMDGMRSPTDLVSMVSTGSASSLPDFTPTHRAAWADSHSHAAMQPAGLALGGDSGDCAQANRQAPRLGLHADGGMCTLQARPAASVSSSSAHATVTTGDSTGSSMASSGLACASFTSGECRSAAGSRQAATPCAGSTASLAPGFTTESRGESADEAPAGGTPAPSLQGVPPGAHLHPGGFAPGLCDGLDPALEVTPQVVGRGGAGWYPAAPPPVRRTASAAAAGGHAHAAQALRRAGVADALDSATVSPLQPAPQAEQALRAELAREQERRLQSRWAAAVPAATAGLAAAALAPRHGMPPGAVRVASFTEPTRGLHRPFLTGAGLGRSLGLGAGMGMGLANGALGSGAFRSQSPMGAVTEPGAGFSQQGGAADQEGDGDEDPLRGIELPPWAARFAPRVASADALQDTASGSQEQTRGRQPAARQQARVQSALDLVGAAAAAGADMAAAAGDAAVLRRRSTSMSGSTAGLAVPYDALAGNTEARVSARSSGSDDSRNSRGSRSDDNAGLGEQDAGIHAHAWQRFVGPQSADAPEAGDEGGVEGVESVEGAAVAAAASDALTAMWIAAASEQDEVGSEEEEEEATAWFDAPGVGESVEAVVGAFVPVPVGHGQVAAEGISGLVSVDAAGAATLVLNSSTPIRTRVAVAGEQGSDDDSDSECDWETASEWEPEEEEEEGVGGEQRLPLLGSLAASPHFQPTPTDASGRMSVTAAAAHSQGGPGQHGAGAVGAGEQGPVAGRLSGEALAGSTFPTLVRPARVVTRVSSAGPDSGVGTPTTASSSAPLLSRTTPAPAPAPGPALAPALAGTRLGVHGPWARAAADAMLGPALSSSGIHQGTGLGQGQGGPNSLVSALSSAPSWHLVRPADMREGTRAGRGGSQGAGAPSGSGGGSGGSGGGSSGSADAQTASLTPGSNRGASAGLGGGTGASAGADGQGRDVPRHGTLTGRPRPGPHSGRRSSSVQTPTVSAPSSSPCRSGLSGLSPKPPRRGFGAFAAQPGWAEQAWRRQLAEHQRQYGGGSTPTSGSAGGAAAMEDDQVPAGAGSRVGAEAGTTTPPHQGSGLLLREERQGGLTAAGAAAAADLPRLLALLQNLTGVDTASSCMQAAILSLTRAAKRDFRYR